MGTWQPRRELPKGFRIKSGHLRIAVNLTEATFNRVIERCKKEGKQFSDVIEDTLKCGFLCLDESDELELESIYVNMEADDR